MECTGFERNIGECETVEIPEESGRELYKFIDIAGVSCLRVKPPATSSSTIASVPVNTETHTVARHTESSTAISVTTTKSTSASVPVVNPPRAAAQDQENMGMLVGLVFILVLFGIALAVIFG